MKKKLIVLLILLTAISCVLTTAGGAAKGNPVGGNIDIQATPTQVSSPEPVTAKGGNYDFRYIYNIPSNRALDPLPEWDMRNIVYNKERQLI
jgi:hypothetical protein